MATLMTTLKVERRHPGWLFWLAWFAATFVGAFLYFIPVGAIQIVLGLDRLTLPLVPGQVSAGLLVLAGVLCGAACGSTIGLAQWLVLRTQIKRSGLWVAATIAGYATIGLLPLIVSAFQPDWLEWAFTLIISGKMHWLARVQPDWPGGSWPAGAVTLTLFGAALGIAQWLVLRGRVAQAGWWVAISTACWALTAALSVSVVPWATFVFTSWGVPTLIAAAGMVWLLRHSAPTMQTS